MKNEYKIVSVVLGILFFIAPFTGCAVAPPVQEMSDARQAIQADEAVGARTKAPEPYIEAQENIESAESALQAGDYSKAREQALRAKINALEARSKALTDEDP